MMTELHFPFSAVSGQDEFKLALILAAVNPAIGGVVISGPRGSAKSTLARGLADLLPVTETEHTPEFVTLPLGTSEEMLLGTLDLQRVLDDQNVAFRPGLLSKAHGGVLYVDEVNLLPDHLVDQLLDVAASGVNRVERDGISHSHPARFLLIGTMNPDEGELRPQLHDRFGLCVELKNQYSSQERVEIVKSREAFDRNPAAFCNQYADQQGVLLDRIASARLLLNDVACNDDIRLEIAERCSEAQVDGLRADIVWYRAALAHAAWFGRDQVTTDDIDAVESLALAHRRKSPPENTPRPPAPPIPPQGGFKRPEDSHRPQSGQQSRAEGDWGSMVPQQQRCAELNSFQTTATSSPKQAVVKQMVSDLAGRKTGKAANGNHRSASESHKPNWFSTLIANSGIWPPKSLKFQKAREGQPVLHLVLLDTSASTLAQGPESLGKAAVLKIAEQAYLQREQLSIFGFGNNQVENLLPKVRAPKELKNWLDSLPAGGGTPIRAALEQVQSYLGKAIKQNPALQIRTYVITDGRTSAHLNDVALPGDTVLIDIEQSAVKRGRGAQLAAELSAQYLPLPAV
ncbi:ATP-binding protein [Pontibacterium sp.]|uniref:ATP-binding protein n=1 Tax=Pontibacterium sp. TaxID=2036026 RepID=UPI0035156459